MRHGLLVGAVCLLAGCSSIDTRASDVRAIEKLETDWAATIKAKDLDKWVTFYAEDGSVLIPNAPPVTGRDNIRAMLAPVLRDPNYAYAFHAGTIEASGDLAYSRGVYEATRTDRKTHEPVTDQGKYVTVYKRQSDGSWKAIQDIASSDLPSPPYNR
jgi:uncharacterized protein (TIGR02246 family)